jgi:hypothetical protein
MREDQKQGHYHRQPKQPSSSSSYSSPSLPSYPSNLTDAESSLLESKISIATDGFIDHFVIIQLKNRLSDSICSSKSLNN